MSRKNVRLQLPTDAQLRQVSNEALKVHSQQSGKARQAAYTFQSEALVKAEAMTDAGDEQATACLELSLEAIDRWRSNVLAQLDILRPGDEPAEEPEELLQRD